MEISVKVLTTTVGDSEPPSSLHPKKANFTLPEISDQYQGILSEWISEYKSVGEVLDLYFSVEYHSDMYLQNQILTLTQALETFHRRKVGGKYLDEDRFDQYKQNLIENIPEEFDQSFKDHLKKGTFKFANEYSLRKRLNELVDDYETILSDLPMDYGPNRLNKIVNTRNYLTHYDESIFPRVDPDQYTEVVLNLKGILQTLILDQIGIPEDQIRSRLGQRFSELTS